MKPASIKKFDMLYLGSIVVSMVSVVLGWGQMTAMMEAELAAQGQQVEAMEGIASGALIGGLVVGFGISLLLWALISVWRIEFVKWVLILFVGWGVVSTLISMGTVPFNLVFILGLVATALSVASVWFLFQPDAKAWFNREDSAQSGQPPTDVFD